MSRGKATRGGFAADTWAYDPATNSWTDLNPTGPRPLGRAGHAMVYDPDTRRVIMFGGNPSGVKASCETWAYAPPSPSLVAAWYLTRAIERIPRRVHHVRQKRGDSRVEVAS